MNKKVNTLIDFVISLIKKSIQPPEITGGGIYLSLVFNNIEEITELINQFINQQAQGFYYNLNGQNGIDIVINKNPKIYYGLDYFKKHFSFENIYDNFSIIFEDNNYLIYDNTIEVEKDKIFINHDDLKPFYEIITNYIYYFKILRYLSEEESSDLFCSFHDIINNKLIIILPENGKFEIGYKYNLSQIEIRVDLKKYYDLITNENREFSPFFKKSVYDSLKTFEMADRFEHLIININTIYENAKNNYDLFLSGISVQSFIDELREEQLKYFSAFREVLNKIFTYSISIPVSITATVLGIINVPKKNPLILSIIIISFLLFTSLSIYYQCYLKKDILILWNDIKLDYKRFIQLEIFKKDYTRKGFKILLRKIQMIINLINIIIICLILFAAIIIIIFIYVLCSNPTEHSQYLKIIIN
ncbi:MAG: hypothetical protein WCR42_13390 [bacterium]